MEQINYHNTIFILGNVDCCYAFDKDRRITKLKCSFADLYQELRESNFIKVNINTLINTKYFIDKSAKREIIMKDGTIHKVSRQKWKEFEQY